MESITSADGTRIAYTRKGNGPPLLLIHGVMWNEADNWALVRPGLEQTFTVFGIERRGRGQSGPVTDHPIEREFEDVAVLVDSVGEPVHVLGHSYGALCALGATSLTPNIRSLILYEPPGPRHFHREMLDALYRPLKQGDHEGVIVAMMQDILKVPQAQLDFVRALPVWEGLVTRAPTVPLEIRNIQRYEFDAASFSALQQPTLLLVGEMSDSQTREANEQLHKTLLHSELIELAGQGHGAMFFAPDLFVSTVRDFLVKLT